MYTYGIYTRWQASNAYRYLPIFLSSSSAIPFCCLLQNTESIESTRINALYQYWYFLVYKISSRQFVAKLIHCVQEIHVYLYSIYNRTWSETFVCIETHHTDADVNRLCPSESRYQNRTVSSLFKYIALQYVHYLRFEFFVL